MASQERGQAWFALLTTRIADLVQRHLQQDAAQRQDYLAALESGLSVLEATMQQRQLVPRETIPPIATPAYVAFCQALFAGDYRAARQYAAHKLDDLSS